MYKNLHRWTPPDSYLGRSWSQYYKSGIAHSRDSNALERSNFACMLAALGGESSTVIVVRETHWAFGWVEWIAIHESDDRALTIADDVKGKLSVWSKET